MIKRKLGQGLEVSALSLGAMGYGKGKDIPDRAEMIDLRAAIGQQHAATPAQVALAWLLTQKPWIVPLFGTRKLERLEENLGALSVSLTADDLAEIEATNIRIEGARYPEEILKRSGL